MPERGDAVLPSDLLAFGIGAAGVGDRDLVDTRVVLGEACSDLGLEAEAIGRERAGERASSPRIAL